MVVHHRDDFSIVVDSAPGGDRAVLCNVDKLGSAGAGWGGHLELGRVCVENDAGGVAGHFDGGAYGISRGIEAGGELRIGVGGLDAAAEGNDAPGVNQMTVGMGRRD